MNNLAMPTGFNLKNTLEIESLNIRVEEYSHNKTGAQHIHIAADNNENVFLVALRTVPQDSTGVAHILEHTALCGSEKYPVRDPFFMMIRRSLNTFMNAFTSSDWTAYPFASQNRKDFDNLMDVYLDAVFFSRLDELDFLQEGHRLEFAEPANPNSALTYKGVVFNEMKGAMSSATSILWHTLCKYLYPTTTYHYNSGGDPECITDLTYEQLRAFYRVHYHPSNAIFMTFGDISAQEHQAKFESSVLTRFDKLDREISVPNEKRYAASIAVEEFYAAENDAEPGSESALNKKTHIIIGWMLGESTDLESSMEAQLLNAVLLDNSASPLQQALETTDLGTSPSPLCGLDNSQKEMCFVCGLEGSEPEHGQAVEKLVLDVIQEVAANGAPQEQIEACLHQLELQQREISGDHYPYGLQLILTALTNATHRGDAAALLDLEPVIARLREKIRNPDYIKQLAKSLLLENQHRVRLTLKPDVSLAERKEQAELAQLAKIQLALSETDKQAIVDKALALKSRQEQVDDATILPKVTLTDVPPDLPYTAASGVSEQGVKTTWYDAGTNGLVYQQAILPIPQLTEEQLEILPLYTLCLTELGIGEQTYLQTQMRQSAVCGSIHAYGSAHGTPDNLNDVSGHVVLSAKGLGRNQAEMTGLMEETLRSVRFDELNRIRELIAQTRARREMGVTNSGHALAMTVAASGTNASAKLANLWGGLVSIQALKRLDKQLNDETNVAKLAEQLSALHALISAGAPQLLLVGEQQSTDDYRAVLSKHFSPKEGATFKPFSLTGESQRIQQLWKTNTQVNFCAKAYPTVPVSHPDAAPLSVLGGLLRNGYLHRTIREQGGAYGGGASQDNHHGAFRFYSYRDPRIEGTLDDFDRSIDWLKTRKPDFQPVEEAILGVISSIDKPGSPAGEAKSTFHAELYGRTREIREAFRNRVLKVTEDDLQRVADTYLQPENASTAVITSAEKAKSVAHLGLKEETL
ncbi:MAG: insulinase family protein [bacterium]